MQTLSRALRAQRMTFMAPTPVPSEPERYKYQKYDWDGMRARAYQLGELPPPPTMYAPQHKKLLTDVKALVDAGDIRTLIDFQIKAYNSSRQAIARYRDICVIALQGRRRLQNEVSK